MNCPSDEELLGWLDNPASQNDAVHGHIDSCEACRAAMAHVAALDEAPHVDCIGRYELDTPLGVGGMGMVWRAWDPQLHRHVAVKVLRADSANGRTRLLAEARALAKLQDPHVVAVHDVGEFDGEVFVATELVDGESLATWQSKQPWAEVIAAYVQAAEGLAAAHRAGLVHRDIKPHNLFIDRAGRVRVGDFGLARGDVDAVNDAGDGPTANNARLALGSQTATGTLVGTPAYMAPEQRTGHVVYIFELIGPIPTVLRSQLTRLVKKVLRIRKRYHRNFAHIGAHRGKQLILFTGLIVRHGYDDLVASLTAKHR